MSPTRKTPAQAGAPATDKATPSTASKSAAPTTAGRSAATGAAPRKPSTGSVAFVGAGPGDPGLITVRATELLAEAQVVVLAERSREQLLTWCQPGVTVVDGAFEESGAPLGVAARVKAITGAAKGGRRVVRLVDGDPALYAGLAEEAAGCVKAGCEFQVVPGVPALSAVPAFAGVPLTNRTIREVRVVDAHDTKIDWAAFASKDATLVLSNCTDPDLVRAAAAKLIEAGLDPATPVLTTWAGTHDRATHGRVGARRDSRRPAHGDAAPVGGHGDRRRRRSARDVVLVRDPAAVRLARPGAADQGTGGRVGVAAAVLRRGARGGAHDLGGAAAGAPADGAGDQGSGDRALRVGRRSPRAMRSRRCGRSSRSTDSTPVPSPGSRLPRSGSRPRRTWRPGGSRPTWCPAASSRHRVLLADWPPYDEVFDPINRVFLPRADIATETLVAGLIELGWEVDDVTAYRTVRAAPPPAPVREAIKSGGFDAVVFTSSSTVRNLVGIAGKPHTQHGDRLHRPGDRRGCGGTRPAGRRAGGDAVGTRDPRRRAGGIRPQPGRGGCCRWAVGAANRRRSGRRCGGGVDGYVPGRPAAPASGGRRRCAGLVAETDLAPRQLVLPMFVKEGALEPVPIASMPGVVAHSLESLRKAALEAVAAGVGGLMLFGVPATKDAAGSGWGRPRGRAQRGDPGVGR